VAGSPSRINCPERRLFAQSHQRFVNIPIARSLFGFESVKKIGKMWKHFQFLSTTDRGFIFIEISGLLLNRLISKKKSRLVCSGIIIATLNG
jgi:hypothetical protein